MIWWDFIAQRLAHVPDALNKGIIGHRNAGPDRLDQFLLGHEAASVLAAR